MPDCYTFNVNKKALMRGSAIGPDEFPQLAKLKPSTSLTLL